MKKAIIVQALVLAILVNANPAFAQDADQSILTVDRDAIPFGSPEGIRTPDLRDENPLS